MVCIYKNCLPTGTETPDLRRLLPLDGFLFSPYAHIPSHQNLRKHWRVSAKDLSIIPFENDAKYSSYFARSMLYKQQTKKLSNAKIVVLFYFIENSDWQVWLWCKILDQGRKLLLICENSVMTTPILSSYLCSSIWWDRPYRILISSYPFL